MIKSLALYILLHIEKIKSTKVHTWCKIHGVVVHFFWTRLIHHVFHQSYNCFVNVLQLEFDNMPLHLGLALAL